MSQLISIIEKLSKASPNAVYTPRISSDYDANNIYDYLYVETAIETHYKKTLNELKNSKSIIFLCGSSGDGKSAIIGQNKDSFEKYYDIHIDATHSFRPDQSAVEALNDVFKKYKNGTKSLVVGINMGILLNFAREGSDEHSDIKGAIDHYDLEKKDFKNVHFINFEDYPKFEVGDENITSTFIHELLNKVAVHSPDNPFYDAFLKDIENNAQTVEHKNFHLLSQEAIQKSIVELLATVHLKYDQFLTTRGIIDLIYILLKGPRLLIDQLFESDSNSILSNTQKEDPILYRTKQLDTFILERASNKYDAELQAFIKQFNGECKNPILDKDKPHTLIRTFFLFKDRECSSNYHQKFSQDFDDSSTLEYVRLIVANQNYSIETRSTIQNFYKEIKKAIFAYANKHTPNLSKKELFQFDKSNDYSICAHLEISPDLKTLQEETVHSINNFKCYLKVDEQPIDPIVISLSMYKMILSINQGYRPNKHDRNTIIIFEELLEKIADKVKVSKKLVFMKGDKTYTFKNNIEEIEVVINAN